MCGGPSTTCERFRPVARTAALWWVQGPMGLLIGDGVMLLVHLMPLYTFYIPRAYECGWWCSVVPA